MSEPRFLMVWGCTRNGLSIPAWPTTVDQITVGASACWCSWRLLGANNRELGRGAQVYPDEAACLAALYRGQAGVIRAVTGMLLQAGQWTWRFAIDERPFAVAPRSYQRQRESHYSLQQFMLGLVSARVPAPDSIVDRNAAHCPIGRAATCQRGSARPAGPASAFASLGLPDSRANRPVRPVRPSQLRGPHFVTVVT